MSRAYDFRQKKAINYNEKLSNRKKSNPSSAQKTRGKKSEASSTVSNSSNLRRRKAVNNTYEEDEDDSSESSPAPILGRTESLMLGSMGISNFTAQLPVLEDMSPPILSKECNNDSEVVGEPPNRAKSNPSSARKTRGRKSGASPIISNSTRLRRRKAVDYSYEEDEGDSSNNSQTPARRSPFVLNSPGNVSLNPNLTAHFPVLEDMSPPILTREVNNNMEEKGIDSRRSSPPPQLERMPSEDSPPPELEPIEQMASGTSSISNKSGVSNS